MDDSDDLFPPPLPLDDDDDVALRTSSRTRQRSAPSSSSSDPVQAAPDRSPDQAVQRETKKRRLNEAQEERLRLIELREREQEATRVTIEVPELDPRDDKVGSLDLTTERRGLIILPPCTASRADTRPDASHTGLAQEGCQPASPRVEDLDASSFGRQVCVLENGWEVPHGMGEVEEWARRRSGFEIGCDRVGWSHGGIRG